MNVNRLLPVPLLAAMALPAYAQDDSGLWAMLEQVESLSNVLLLGQDELPRGAVPGENQIRSSQDTARAAGIAGGTLGTHAGLGLRAAVGFADVASNAQTASPPRYSRDSTSACFAARPRRCSRDFAGS
jgi:hypothetical protein